MDSLTQVILGAACGEAVAGKKLGNRALLWGAVGGTIPDLDVFATFFTDEITATAFHRGFMHSFLFAAIAPFLLAKLTVWFYGGSLYRRRGYKIGAMLVWLIFYIGAAAGINFIPVVFGEGLKWYILAPTLGLGFLFARKLWADYYLTDFQEVEVPYRTWVALFFWSIFTHPILDCFTGWGTQIFQPFSDLRVQWNTVSVVDLRATLPFGLAMIAVSFFSKNSRWRQWLLWVGLAWFCGYLAFTCYHKWKVEQIFERSLQAKGIRYQRFMTGPTIFNNTLWNGVAEGDTAFYQGLYSFKDCREEFFKINVLPKNRHLEAAAELDERHWKFVRWFSDGYYNMLETEDKTLRINDLRFGLRTDSVGNYHTYVFPFVVDVLEQGNTIHHVREMDDNLKAELANFQKRVDGVCR